MTDLIFGALENLKDLEFLAKPDFDLLETMSAFESMDPKMDVRLARTSECHPTKLREQKILKKGEEISNEEMLALFDAFHI